MAIILFCSLLLCFSEAQHADTFYCSSSCADSRSSIERSIGKASFAVFHNQLLGQLVSAMKRKKKKTKLLNSYVSLYDQNSSSEEVKRANKRTHNNINSNNKMTSAIAHRCRENTALQRSRDQKQQKNGKRGGDRFTTATLAHITDTVLACMCVCVCCES